MLRFRQLYVVVALVAASLLAGCASLQGSSASLPSPAEVYAERLSQADALAAAGSRDAAVLAYERLAADNPTQGTPWAKVAHIQFTQGNYSQAIVAAEETLRRDPTNREAKSVTAVGGLRLALRSLEDLRDDAALAGDAKTDAMKLAVMLRETLGEPVLEPAPKPKAPPPVVHKRAPVVQQAPPAPPARRAPAPAKRSSNPFGALQ